MPDTTIFGNLALGFVANDAGSTVPGPFPSVDLQAALNTTVSPRTLDLGVQSGLANLVQSLITRLMTSAES